MDIQLSPTQIDVMFKVLVGTPLFASSTLSISMSGRIQAITIGDLCALDTALKAAKVLGFAPRLLTQIQVRIDRTVVAFGEALPKAA